MPYHTQAEVDYHLGTKADANGVYTKAQIDGMIASFITLNHTHGFSVYSGGAGVPEHSHLVEGTTAIGE